jgi:tetratricopeptide (TPR) repeat protein
MATTPPAPPPATPSAPPASQPRIDREETIRSLEEQLRKTPRATNPYEHARVAYRLGMAYAEATGGQTDGLRKALACYDAAAAIFDPRFDPVEHGRVLNAAGIVHRALGNRPKAAELHEQAVGLLEGHDRDNELAGVLNNLGLVRAERGQLDAAVEAFDRALDLFDTTAPDGRRGRAAALYNRGQANQARGTVEGIEAALADYSQALGEIDMEEAPLHWGTLQHSLGVTLTALANVQAEDRERLLQEAVHAFGESLVVFTRRDFPFQFALAKHNVGLAFSRLGGTANLRRALASFEDTLAMLDTRVHAEFRAQAYANMERVEKQLAEQFPGMTRTQHFAHLLGSVREDERKDLLRERIHYLLAIPEPRRSAAVGELDLAMTTLPPDRARLVMTNEFEIVIEMPQDKQEVAYRARFTAHAQIPDEEARIAADTVLDQAISDALGGPQRVFVRDFLLSLGWERP